MKDKDKYELLGQLRVIKVKHEDDSVRPYHLEINGDTELLAEIVKYGSEVLGHLDLLSSGLRAALIEALAREKGMK